MMHTRPRLSIKAIIIKDDKILLLKCRDKEGIWYMSPGGGLEHNEFIIEGLKREAKEEIGFEITPGKLAFEREIIADRQDTPFVSKGFHQVEMYYFAEVIPDSYSEPHKMDTNQIGTEWLTFDDLDRLRVYPHDLKSRIQNSPTYPVPELD